VDQKINIGNGVRSASERLAGVPRVLEQDDQQLKPDVHRHADGGHRLVRADDVHRIAREDQTGDSRFTEISPIKAVSFVFFHIDLTKCTIWSRKNEYSIGRQTLGKSKTSEVSNDNRKKVSSNSKKKSINNCLMRSSWNSTASRLTPSKGLKCPAFPSRSPS
jgi:hypothetical protein